MKAIILAAGVGSRLRPITDKKPKTLVEVNGKPMISYIVDAIKSAGVTDIVVCTGYRAEQLESYLFERYSDVLNISIVNNSAYETTNNMYSLYLARHFLNDDILLMNADLVFDERIIQDIVRQDGAVVAVDEGVYQEESMKVVINTDGIIQNISKQIPPTLAYGCSIDVYKFDKKSTKVLEHEIKKIIEIDQDLNQWSEVLLDKVFSEQLVHAKPFNIEGKKWFEIDNYEDLAKAEILFNCSLPELIKKKAFILDKDGTLTIGRTPIEGVVEFLSKLQEKEKSWVVGSNNSSKTSLDHINGLISVFPNVRDIFVISSLDVSINYLTEKGIKKLFWLANEQVSKELNENFEFDDINPQCLLLTYDNEINYKKFTQIIALVRRGIPYYATHVDIVCPTEDGDIPDIGSYIELIYNSTKVRPEKTFGKPSKAYLNYVLKSLKVLPEEAVLIGDRLYTDILTCENEEVTSVLVLSGETTRSSYEESDIKADIVVPSLKHLMDYI